MLVFFAQQPSRESGTSGTLHVDVDSEIRMERASSKKDFGDSWSLRDRWMLKLVSAPHEISFGECEDCPFGISFSVC
jgi:hypothetical protein